MNAEEGRVGREDWDAAFADIVAHLQGDGTVPGGATVADPGARPVPDDAVFDTFGAGEDAVPDADRRTDRTGDAGARPVPDPSVDPLGDPIGDPVSDPVVDPLAVAREAAAERRARIEREIDALVDPGHYVPPEPAPLPHLDAFTAGAWIAVIAGPLVLLLTAALRLPLPPWGVGAIVLAIVAGFVLLVSRLPRRGDRDPDDDGAVV